MSEQTMKGMANSFPRLVQQLVGKEGKLLKIENPEQYHFDPKQLLELLMRTILVFSKERKFVMCMNEEKTLNLEMFEKAERICRAKNLLDSEEQAKLAQFVASIRSEQEQFDRWNQLLDNAPDEFFDEMTGELMDDPVMLPNSKQILNRDTIEKLLLRTQIDPYDRTPLTKEELIPSRDWKWE
ncbi:uncharacterized protein [Blastocystis hominis]|uniref:U-box domain-containing protein n=1 Tax=Blastocystis hominis TaxID=12968 RepID=D8M7L6_BLAHO|nr:uncharacterized protein [Blastocystis hominis]CBK24055.2 unnamed protein product [Blastocystis hominis]|eukprot:XP_012898103.1 uncharacterized protein [Blastocystis hominis]